METIEFAEERLERRPVARAADSVPPPRNHGIVSSSWITAAGSMSARDLLDTLRVVEQRRVDPRDLPAVAEIFSEVTGRRVPGWAERNRPPYDLPTFAPAAWT